MIIIFEFICAKDCVHYPLVLWYTALTSMYIQ
jgi:hypothetical protein